MRRLRALAVVAALWGAIFIGFSLGYAVKLWLKDSRLIPLGFIPQMAGWGAGFGAASGLIFGLRLMVAERRRTVEKLRLGRILAWGTIGALIPVGIEVGVMFLRFPNIWSINGSHEMFASILTYTVVEGMLAAGVTFAIARRGPPLISRTPLDELGPTSAAG